MAKENSYDWAGEKLRDLSDFIAYLEATSEEEWLLDKVRSEDNNENCLMGHLVNWAYGKDYEGIYNPIWEMFEEGWATTYMIYPVNDGENPKYPQASARERCIAYLKDLQSGEEKRTYQLLEEDRQRALKDSPSEY